MHIVVLFVLWLTFLGKEPIGTGSGVLVQVGFVDESAGMFESNADRPEQTEAERPRENEDELLTQTDEESIHIEKKEEKKDKTIQENKKDERIANQVKMLSGKEFPMTAAEAIATKEAARRATRSVTLRPAK